MECKSLNRPSHKDWRRLVKKVRRQRLRQEAARKRDEEADRIQKILEKREDYVEWQRELEKLEKEREKRAAEQHEKLEKAWIEAEEKAQKEWKILQEKKAKARELQLLQEAKIRKEFEDMQENTRKKKEAERRRRDEQKRMFDKMKKEFDAYIDDGARTPKQLRSINETQPGKEICPFFNKTGSCRYGDICSRNHQRPSLSKVVLVPNFYTHFSLERHSHDYDSDSRLEYDHRETRSHFRDFYFDVVPELEKFGKIRTLQYCRNTEPHLRGNLYVEYMSEREAARAMRGLKGRWYAGRQLHCEFVNLKSWRGAICGMMRCPKGSSCNFLHTFRNPTEDYGVKSPPLWQKRQEMFAERDKSSSRRGNTSSRRSNWEDEDRKNWRWSESPERDDRRNDDRRNDDRRPMQYRNNQRNFQHRNQFDNRRKNFDNRGRNDNRNFYNNRRGNFDRNRFDGRDNFHRQPRRFDDRNDRFKRRYSGSDNEEYAPKFRRKDKGSRSRSRSISRSPSRSRSRSVSRSRSRGSRSVSRSRSRSISKSASRSRTRSRSPMNDMIDMDEYRKGRSKEVHSIGRDSRSPSRERRARPPSPRVTKEPTKKSTTAVSKWDSEKREDSDTQSQDSRSRSRSRSPYRESKNNVREPERERPREAPRERPRERPREVSRERPREVSRERPREVSRERPREVSRERPRETSRDRPREHPREHPREQPRESQREPPRESQKHHREPRNIDYSQPPPPGTQKGDKEYEWDTTDSDN